MIEGQNGLTWPRWQAIARAVEDLGFVGLYRSDHVTNATPPDLESLELWVSLAWLASHTRRIAFGPLVALASFRHPVHPARMAARWTTPRAVGSSSAWTPAGRSGSTSSSASTCST